MVQFLTEIGQFLETANQITKANTASSPKDLQQY